jgi:hypothetical protein
VGGHIKDFRNEKGDIESPTVFDWAERFRKYLVEHAIFQPSEQQQKNFVKSIFAGEFKIVLESFVANTRAFAFQKQTKSVKEKYPKALFSVISRRLELFQDEDFYFGYDADKASEMLGIFKEEYESAKNQAFSEMPLNEEDDGRFGDLLQQLAKCVISRAKPDWFTTGLVFAGYGKDELFPSLICLEVGCTVNDELRWIEKRRVDIDRGGVTAEIIPFAQREVVDTLLFGRADRYERRVVAYFTKSGKQLAAGIVDQLTKKGRQQDDYMSRIEAAIAGIETKFREDAETLKAAFSRDTLDSVRFMPKPDLAAFAESLVTVTSMMRKASIGPETVGGPIDVAIISRHEGFVWVKRKHYFDINVNRRYDWRAFGLRKGGEENA